MWTSLHPTPRLTKELTDQTMIKYLSPGVPDTMPVFSEVTPIDSMALGQHGTAKPAFGLLGPFCCTQLYLQKSAQGSQLQLCSPPALGLAWR